LSGFAFGIALTITIKQLPVIAGVALPASGSGGVLPLLWHLAAAVPRYHAASVALGVVALASLAMLRRVRGLPASALVLAAGMGLAAAIDLPAHHVALVGTLVITLPAPSWPKLTLDDWSRVRLPQPRKNFFLKKKKQKTFDSATRGGFAATDQISKVFLVLFFQKKNCFLSLS